jgi:hypothetical protein
MLITMFWKRAVTPRPKAPYPVDQFYSAGLKRNRSLLQEMKNCIVHCIIHHISPWNILQSYHSLPRQSNVTIQTPPFIDIISPAINLHLVPEFGYPRLHDSQIFGCRRWPSQWHRNIRSLELIRICYCFLSKSQIIISLFILSIHPMYTQGIPVSIPSIDVIYLSLTSPNRWPSHEPLSTTVNHCWPSLMTIAQIYQFNQLTLLTRSLLTDVIINYF